MVISDFGGFYITSMPLELKKKILAIELFSDDRSSRSNINVIII